MLGLNLHSRVQKPVCLAQRGCFLSLPHENNAILRTSVRDMTQRPRHVTPPRAWNVHCAPAVSYSLVTVCTRRGVRVRQCTGVQGYTEGVYRVCTAFYTAFPLFTACLLCFMQFNAVYCRFTLCFYAVYCRLLCFTACLLCFTACLLCFTAFTFYVFYVFPVFYVLRVLRVYGFYGFYAV